MSSLILTRLHKSKLIENLAPRVCPSYPCAKSLPRMCSLIFPDSVRTNIYHLLDLSYPNSDFDYFSIVIYTYNNLLETWMHHYWFPGTFAGKKSPGTWLYAPVFLCPLWHNEFFDIIVSTKFIISCSREFS